MKVVVEFDVTPEEARALFGLPDVKPFQDAVLSELQERVKSGLTALDPGELLRTVLKQYAGGFEQMQGFLSRFEQAASNRKRE